MKKGLLLYLLCSVCALYTWAQTRTVTGLVTDRASGAPLPGVTVQGGGGRTATGNDGAFSVKVTGAPVLFFSATGYISREAQAPAGDAVMQVQLQQDTTRLSEVVVIGYGQQSRRFSTQAVSVIESGSLQNRQEASPQQMLQGQAAGVQMTNSSGMLGAAALVRIRGVASITAGSQPLFVIDGVPLNDGSYSTNYGAGDVLNPLLELNPDDIESLTVLKDAAAAAIYGSRGSNGVVLIKTRKGAANSKTRISLDYYTGWTRPTNTPDVMSPEEYRSFYNDYVEKAANAPHVEFPANGFNWPGAVERTGRTNSYALSASGGNDKTKFYVGGSYLNEESYAIANGMKKLTGRLNLQHDVSSKVRFGVNFSTAYIDMDRISAEDDAFAPFTMGFLQNPFKQAYDEQGRFLDPANNVLAVAKLNRNKFYSRRNVGNAYAEIALLKDLRLKTDWGIDQLQTEERYRNMELITPGGAAGRLIWQDNKWLTTNSLNYERLFGGMHNVSLLAAHSFETSRFDDIVVSGTGFISDKLLNVGAAAIPTATSASGKEWALESYIFRGNYRFRDRYLAEASFRRDGSSRFGAGRRYGNFWAVSGGWILSEEQFMKQLAFINYLKLSAGYGVTGNDRIGYYDYLGVYGTGANGNYAGQPGLYPSMAPNRNLGWEETRQLNLGLVAELLDNRLQVAVDYYNKDSRDLLLYIAYPSTTGFPYAVKNAGRMRNKGIDLQVTATPVRSRNIEWTTTLNMGFVKNKVLALPPDSKDEEGRNFIIGSYAGQRAIEGYSLNSFYLLKYKGINPDNGDPEWYTKDGKTTTAPTANDQVIVGSAIPRFTGGFNNRVRYKGFDLGLDFYFSYGNKIMLGDLWYLEDVVNYTSFNKSRDMLNYWKKKGDNAYAPAATSPSWSNGNSFAQLSTQQLQDGSFLRLKTLTLGYNLPAGLLRSTRLLSSARVFAMGQNLWTLTSKDFRGADPEVSRYGTYSQVVGESFFTMPQPKTITVGVNLVF